MLIIACMVLLCVLLVIGVSVPLAFGAILILIAVFGGHEVSGFMPAGHWKMNTVILLAIPLFILAGGIMERGKIAAPLQPGMYCFAGFASKSSGLVVEYLPCAGSSQEFSVMDGFSDGDPMDRSRLRSPWRARTKAHCNFY